MRGSIENRPRHGQDAVGILAQPPARRLVRPSPLAPAPLAERREAAAIARSGRDFRIDFFRGLALIMIFIDHSPGNDLTKFTLHRMGFADAAEVFVLLSGISAALAYRGSFGNAGWLAGAARVAGRCGRIYVAHLMTLLAIAALAILVLQAVGNAELLNRLDLDPLFRETDTMLVATLALAYHPHYLDILPLYVLLLALVPFTLRAAQRHPLALLAASAAVYAAASLRGWNLPRVGSDQGWYFNPLTWQLLFLTGLVIGSRPAGQRLPSWPRAALAMVAAAFVGFAFLAAAPWTALPGLDGAALIPDSWRPTPSKTNLSPWRLADVLALAFLAAHLIPRDSPIGRAWLARQVARCGAHSLEMYCLSTFLSVLAFGLFTEMGTEIGFQLAVTAAGVCVMAAGAALVSWYRSKPWQSRASYPGVHRRV